MSDTVDIKKFSVPQKDLRWMCPEELLQFKCTTDLVPLKDFIGQERAVNSIQFGLAVGRQGYNLFLTGLSGTGKAVTIKAHLEKFLQAKAEEGVTYPIFDWCYVYNFSDPDQPHILKLVLIDIITSE